MKIIHVNSNENDKNVIWKLIMCTSGRLSLDEALEDLVIEEEDLEEIERQKEIFDKIEEIVKKYFTKKEQLIFHCVIRMNKRVSHVKEIVGYDDWRTTSNNIERIFKMLRIYYEFENLDKAKIQSILKKHFDKLELKVIKLLEQRYTVHEIKDKLGYNYSKAYLLQKDILNRMKKLPQPVKSYYEFIVNIRKFKKLRDFDIEGNEIT